MLENYLNKGLINTELKTASKEGVLREMSLLIAGKCPNLTSSAIESALNEREDIDSTGIENGIAIPHAKIEGLGGLVIAVGRSKNGINFKSHDNEPTHLFFVMLAPAGAAGEHMKVLARLAKILGLQGLKERLLLAKDNEEMYRTLIEADKRLC